MAPLLPLGFAILGLGCTIPLTIGGSELDPSVIEPPEDDAGPDPTDAGPPRPDPGPPPVEDAGPAQDAGACVPPGGFTTTGYTSCCPPDIDVWQGTCYSAPQGWSCSSLRVCSYNGGGSCFSTGHTCTGFGDCCSSVCYKGFCASTNRPDLLAIQPEGTACRLYQDACKSYSDCCSQNCAFGMCDNAPTPPRSCGGFLEPCKNSNDCCSLECDNGNCRDNTLPPYLQTAGAHISDSYNPDAVHNDSEMVPQFRPDNVEDVAGLSPMRAR